MSNCIICDESMEKQKHTPVTCLCGFKACRVCCSTYILDQTVAKCMNNDCKIEWSRKFMVENFTKCFLSDKWKKNAEKVLFDKEKALLPATQGVIEQRKEINDKKVELEDLNRELRNLKARRDHLEQVIQSGCGITRTNRHFVRACPSEDCRGFLSSQWKCGLCSKSTCRECHVVIDGNPEDHVCNKDDVETAKLLDKDTKPCPKCAIGIFKIEGCDQMWCVQCHTAFSWRTGHIQTNIHNPHYYEYMRRNGGDAPRTVGDNFVCGEEITHGFVSDFGRLLRSLKLDMKFKTVISNIVQSILHLRTQAGTYQVNAVEDNLELRVDYLNKLIDDNEFRMKIQRKSKLHEKKHEIGLILDLFIRTTTEILLRMGRELQVAYNSRYTENPMRLNKTIEEYLKEVEGIREYANDCLKDISTAFMCKRKEIHFYTCDRGRPSGTGVVTGCIIYSRDVLCKAL